jgi:outer membrane protein TolC
MRCAVDLGLRAACLAAAVLIAGCTSRGFSVQTAGAQVLMGYAEKNAAQSDRFAELAKAQPAAPAKTEAKSAAPLDGFVDPLTRSGDRIPITLESCIRRALANNLGIQIARYGPPIAHTSVREAEAMFDPSWFLNNALSRVKQKAGSFILGANVLIARQWDFSTGLEALIPTGATVSLAQDWTGIRSNSAFILPNPQYASAVRLSASQPLLRGGGVEVTTSPIVLARLDEKISVADFKTSVMNTILDVEASYWQLVLAETQVQAIIEAMEAAKENLRIVRLRFQEGKDKRVVVSLAESAVTSRQADLVSARLRLAQTSDRLKRLINDPELPFDQPGVLAATELPMAAPLPVGLPMLRQSMQAALQNRPEMQQADLRITQAGVRERVARNAELPQLDLAASYGFTGLDPDVDRAINEQFETRYYDWSVGLDLSIPIGNRARVAAHERSQLNQAVALKDREDTRQKILLEVSEAVRNLAAAEEAVQARRAARQAAEQTLHDGQAFVSAGAALLKDLLDVQRDLADAKVREMEAMASYMVGLAALQRAMGTLLEYNDIHVVDDYTAAPRVPRAAAAPAPAK